MKYVMEGNPENGSLIVPHLIIAPTYDCNLSCQHCYNGDLGSGVSGEQWKDFIGRWSDFVGEGIVHFKGGEPFAYKGLDELLDYSAERSLSVFLTSNGTLIDDEKARDLSELYRRTNGKVILSLNGSTSDIDELLREEGVYQKTIAAAKRLRSNDVPFDINYVTHSGNEEDTERAVYLAKELGAVQFNLLPLVQRGSAKENTIGMPDLSKVLAQVNRARNNGASEMLEWSVADMISKIGSGEYSCNGCVVGFRKFAYVTPDGNVYSCPNTVMEEHRLGTIDDSFEELFENGRAGRLREIHSGRLVCKGELEEYRVQPQSMKKLVEEEQLIKRKIAETERNNEDQKPIAVCFNRNW